MGDESMPKISVVLPVYNGMKYIEESIESILHQTLIDWELIIVNDCSTDSTSDIIKRYADLDKRISVINNSTNQKLPRSLNIGFSYANGEYLTWTSDDNIYENNAFEIMSNYLDENPLEVLVCTKMDYISDNAKYKGVTSEDYSNAKMCLDNCIGASFMYKREVLGVLGEYNTNFFLVEDYEYWLRILFHYKSIGYINKVLYHYRQHAGSLTSTRYREIQIRNAELHSMYMRNICDLIPAEKEYLCRIYFRIVATIGYSHKLYHLVREYVPELCIVKNGQCKEKMIVYGAGCIGRKFAEKNKKNIIAFADRDEKKVGACINGIYVISLNEMKNKSKVANIVITSGLDYTYSMLKAVFDLGISDCYVYTDDWN